MTPWLTKYNSPDYTLKAIKEGEKVEEDEELPEAAKYRWPPEEMAILMARQAEPLKINTINANSVAPAIYNWERAYDMVFKALNITEDNHGQDK